MLSCYFCSRFWPCCRCRFWSCIWSGLVWFLSGYNSSLQCSSVSVMFYMLHPEACFAFASRSAGFRFPVGTHKDKALNTCLLSKQIRDRLRTPRATLSTSLYPPPFLPRLLLKCVSNLCGFKNSTRFV